MAKPDRPGLWSDRGITVLPNGQRMETDLNAAQLTATPSGEKLFPRHTGQDWERLENRFDRMGSMDIGPGLDELKPLFQQAGHHIRVQHSYGADHRKDGSLQLLGRDDGQRMHTRLSQVEPIIREGHLPDFTVFVDKSIDIGALVPGSQLPAAYAKDGRFVRLADGLEDGIPEKVMEMADHFAHKMGTPLTVQPVFYNEEINLGTNKQYLPPEVQYRFLDQAGNVAVLPITAEMAEVVMRPSEQDPTLTLPPELYGDGYGSNGPHVQNPVEVAPPPAAGTLNSPCSPKLPGPCN
jgi:hypothetical protein